MDVGLWARGLALGFVIAAAVGPISLLVIRRTLASGPVVGLASGLGVATADSAYAAVAAFGMTAVSDVLVGNARPLALVGGAFLVLIGLRTLRSRPTEAASTSGEGWRGRGLIGAYASILGLTLANPMTILSFAALFVGLGVRAETGGAASIVAGVLCGSGLWWLLLTGIVSVVRGRISLRALVWVNVASGALVTGFGVIAMWSGLKGG